MPHLTKTLSDGRIITLAAEPADGSALPRCVARAEDGALIDWAGTVSPLPEAARPAPELTHRLSRVVLTAEEATSLEALLREARAAYDATPEGTAYGLRCRRDKLVRAVEDIAGLIAHRRETAFDDEGGDGLGTYLSGEGKADERRRDEARKALDDFDAAHPEVVAAVRAEREEEKQRLRDAAFDL
ncbi:hypothetical protein [Streptomyces albidoflavus]|uniref:hypothetical protein n=1 Tax=Streptomyces albidoflavus TaxID=1886 RepID=UPI001022148B|nr:hypothetical protein [Streptomyces albidoflavus]RZF02947.1 hypothetical protein C0R05_32575 [Streptomyces albidoflavus]